MLAGRLVRAARDILAEYSEFKIPDLLARASSLSAQRGQQQDQQYIQQAQEIRRRAEEIIQRTKIEKYPSDLRKFLRESKYSSALPEHVATILLHGFPDDKNIALSSSEVVMYTQLVNTSQSELGVLDIAARKLNIEDVIIPPGEISLDVILPRTLFESRSDRFIHTLSRFISVMSYIIELATGSENAPTLTYTSTSDPVTGVALIGVAAWGFLHFYKLALEVAEKQISLWKMVKEFRGSSLSNPANLEDQVKTVVDDCLAKAVEGTVASIPPKVSVERVNEIKVAISKDARVVVQAIANGARVGITIESLGNIALFGEGAPELTPEKVTEELTSQRVLEDKVQQALSLLGGPTPALLSVETPRTDPASPQA